LKSSFTIDAGPGTLWKIDVIVHPNKKSMQQARGKHRNFKPSMSAWCHSFGTDDAIKKNRIAEIHFNRSNLTLEHVVHESVHAAVNWAQHCKLDLSTGAGDEIFAEALEHIVCGIRWSLKKFCKIRI